MKILTDIDKIQTFRSQYVRFSIYNNYLSTKADNIVGISELKDYIVQKNIEKDKRKCIFFNMTYNEEDHVKDKEGLVSGLKTKDMMYLPNICMVDLDFKTKEQKKQLKIDRGANSFKNAYLSLLNLLKEDPVVLYMDTSHSRGIKIFINVISDYYINNIDDFIYNFKELKNDKIIDYVYKKNAHVVLEYLSDRYNLLYHDNQNIDYYDKVSFKASQITYSSKGVNIIINTNAHILYYELKQDVSFDDYFELGDNKLTNSNEYRLQTNNSFSYNFFNFIKNNPDVYDKVILFSNLLLKHYDERIIFSLYYLDIKYLKIYYRLYCKSYGGSGLNKILKDFDTFNRYIHKKEPKFTIGLKTLFWGLLKEINYNK